jgi:ubiquinone/menaquinone biosynthesis C-methylase UbiE
MGHRRDHEWLETFDGEGADRYDAHARLLRGLHERTARRVAALLPPGGRYVDVGTGPGTLPSRVASLRPDVAVTGVDLSPRMVQIASRRLAGVAGADRGRVLLGDAAALPLETGSADVVTAVLTAHHWADLRAGVAELERVLAPGGTATIVEMRGPARHVARALSEAGLPTARRAAWAFALPALVRLDGRRP